MTSYNGLRLQNKTIKVRPKNPCLKALFAQNFKVKTQFFSYLCYVFLSFFSLETEIGFLFFNLNNWSSAIFRYPLRGRVTNASRELIYMSADYQNK